MNKNLIARTKKPLISVITAVYNGEQYFEQTIQSVLNQSYKNVEYIVIDGGSTDNTPNIINKYSNQLYYLEERPKKGVYNAWNKALEQAKGEWICFLGADDYFWSEDVLDKVIPHLNQALPNSRLVYGKNNWVSLKDGSIIMTLGKPWEEIKNKFLREEMCIPHAGSFHHRSLFIDHGKFDTSFRMASDYEFLLRELKQRSAYYVDNIIVAGVRIGGMTGSLKNMVISHREIRQARHKNGLPISSADIFDFITVYSYVGLRFLLGEKISSHLADVYRRITGQPPIWTK